MKKPYDKVFVFHGCDYKVGTTMTAQAAAELAAECRKDLRVLFLCLNGRESTSYCREAVNSIQAIKMKVDNRLLTHDELIRCCVRQKQLFVLGGASGILNHRHYSPDFAAYVLEMADQVFDLILVDSGNEIDSGLAVGALQMTENRLMVLGQNETLLSRMEALMPIYKALELRFRAYVVNRYMADDPHDARYLRKRLKLEEGDQLICVQDQYGFSRYAEMDKTTLLEYKNQEYVGGISEILMYLFEKAGIEGGVEIRSKKKLPFGKW